jgi:predicted lipid carrier protein YhbT
MTKGYFVMQRPNWLPERLPTWPLTLWLRGLPDPVHEALAERLIAHLLRGQEELDERIELLEGRRLCLRVTDTGNSWQFIVRDGRPRRDVPRRPWDVRISGSLADLLLLASRREDPDTLFFGRRLTLEGETETGLLVKNLLDSLDFDLEAHLVAVLGAGPGRRVFGLIQGLPSGSGQGQLGRYRVGALPG